MSKSGSSAKASPQDLKLATMSVGLVYPLYLQKVQRKGRTEKELLQVIRWLTGYTTAQLRRQIAAETSFKDFFRVASLNPHARLVTGMICGVRIEEIKTPLSRKIRILDKLVDELAKGRKMEQILRTAPPR